jgi:hypothetical protein
MTCWFEAGQMPQFSYTGNPIMPEPDVRFKGKVLEKDRHYTLSYSNNTSRGTASVTATGINEFSGTITRQFKIA